MRREWDASVADFGSRGVSVMGGPAGRLEQFQSLLCKA